jgi:signal peptidase II
MTLSLLALALVAAGAVGNLSDRLAFGCVRDFLDVYLIHYPVFNVADILITVGAGLLVVELLRRKRPEAPESADTSHATK